MREKCDAAFSTDLGNGNDYNDRPRRIDGSVMSRQRMKLAQTPLSQSVASDGRQKEVSNGFC